MTSASTRHTENMAALFGGVGLEDVWLALSRGLFTVALRACQRVGRQSDGCFLYFTLLYVSGCAIELGIE